MIKVTALETGQGNNTYHILIGNRVISYVKWNDSPAALEAFLDPQAILERAKKLSQKNINSTVQLSDTELEIILALS